MYRIERTLYPHFYPVEGDFYPTSTPPENVAPMRRPRGFDYKAAAAGD